MKHCNSCDKTKGKAQFGSRVASIDGLSAKCKDCQRAYDKARLRNPGRMKARREYQKTTKGKIAHANACKTWIEKNEKKRACHVIVGNALRAGILTSSTCEVCGEADTHGHHDDYNSPLDVRWLCNTHHNEWHRENGEGLNAK